METHIRTETVETDFGQSARIILGELTHVPAASYPWAHGKLPEEIDVRLYVHTPKKSSQEAPRWVAEVTATEPGDYELPFVQDCKHPGVHGPVARVNAKVSFAPRP